MGADVPQGGHCESPRAHLGTQRSLALISTSNSIIISNVPQFWPPWNRVMSSFKTSQSLQKCKTMKNTKSSDWALPSKLQSSLSSHRGLVPGPTVDAKIRGCSSPDVGHPYPQFCIHGFSQPWMVFHCVHVEKSPCTNRHISNLCCSRVSCTLLFVLTCHHTNSLAENHVILFITISWCPAQSQTQYKTAIMNWYLFIREVGKSGWAIIIF